MSTNTAEHQIFETPEDIVHTWWKALEHDRGARAELRRTGELTDVALSPSFIRLRLRLMSTQWTNADAIALVAGVLARVRTDDPPAGSYAVRMARPRHKGGNAPVSGMRFRRILQARERSDLYPRLIRAIALTDNEAPVLSLSRDLYWWGDRVRREWAFAYYSSNIQES